MLEIVLLRMLRESSLEEMIRVDLFLVVLLDFGSAVLEPVLKADLAIAIFPTSSLHSR